MLANFAQIRWACFLVATLAGAQALAQLSTGQAPRRELAQIAPVLGPASSGITVTPQRIRLWRPGPQRVNAKNTTAPWAYVAGASAVLAGALVVNRIVEHKQNAKDWGKRGQMTLATETKIGRSSLPPGRYVVRHYADPALGNEVLFEGKGKSGVTTPAGSQSSQLTLITKCRIIAMDHKADETMVIAVPDGETPRILSLQIKGEKIAHIITQE